MILRDYAKDVHVLGPGESVSLGRDSEGWYVVRTSIGGDDGLILLRGDYKACRSAVDAVWAALIAGKQAIDLREFGQLEASEPPRIVRLVPPARDKDKGKSRAD